MNYKIYHCIINKTYSCMYSYFCSFCSPLVLPNTKRYLLKSSPKDMFIDFREQGKDRESVKEKHQSVPSTCALTRDQAHNILMYGRMLQPPELPSQGKILSFIISFAIFKYSSASKKFFHFSFI